MALTLKQQYQVLKAVDFAAANLDNYVRALDALITLETEGGLDVKGYLAGVITAEQVLSARTRAVAERDWIRGKVAELMGEGLEDRRPSATP